MLGRGGEDTNRVAVADPTRVSRGELEEPDLLPDEGRPGEGVVLTVGEQVPAQHGELAGHGHRGDVGASPRSDPLAEGPERSGVLTATHAASTRRCLVSEEPCLEMPPWRAGADPEWWTRASSPK